MNQTQEKILNIALELFNEKGFTNVTMREIAAETGIAVGNVTYYYHQKSDMIPALLNDPIYLSRENVKTLTEFFELISDMLDALKEKRFFFRNNDLLHCNDDFYKNYGKMQQQILHHLEMNFSELVNQNVIIPLSLEEIQSITHFMLSQHMVWVANTISPAENAALDKTDALLLHCDFMKHLVTEAYQEELSSIQQSIKNGRFV